MTTTKSKQGPKTMSKQLAKRRRVTFLFEADNPGEVILMGDFNHWNPKKHAMKNDGTGKWKKVVMLEPGRYEYKFLVDGEWKNDPRNSQTCWNCFGTQNSVLHLNEK